MNGYAGEYYDYSDEEISQMYENGLVAGRMLEGLDPEDQQQATHQAVLNRLKLGGSVAGNQLRSRFKAGELGDEYTAMARFAEEEDQAMADLWTGEQLKTGAARLNSPQDAIALRGLEVARSEIATDDSLTEPQRQYAFKQITDRETSIRRLAKTLPAEEIGQSNSVKLKQIVDSFPPDYQNLPYQLSSDGEVQIPRGVKPLEPEQDPSLQGVQAWLDPNRMGGNVPSQYQNQHPPGHPENQPATLGSQRYVPMQYRPGYQPQPGDEQPNFPAARPLVDDQQQMPPVEIRKARWSQQGYAPMNLARAEDAIYVFPGATYTLPDGTTHQKEDTQKDRIHWQALQQYGPEYYKQNLADKPLIYDTRSGQVLVNTEMHRATQEKASKSDLSDPVNLMNAYGAAARALKASAAVDDMDPASESKVFAYMKRMGFQIPEGMRAPGEQQQAATDGQQPASPVGQQSELPVGAEWVYHKTDTLPDKELPHPASPGEARKLHNTWFITPDGRRKWAP